MTQMGAAGTSAGAPGAGTTGTQPPAASSCTERVIALRNGMHLVIDESASMVFPSDLWSPLGSAMDALFTSDAAARVDLGVQFFEGQCDPGSYSQPALPIGPTSGQQPALDAAMSMRTHGPGAATALALAGAYDQARQWSAMNGGSASVLLITGSEPSGCLGSAASAASTAASGLTGMPSIATHVVALRALPSLDSIAQSGGTNAALAVSDPTATATLLAAMQSAVSSAACEISLPAEALMYAPDRINLVLTIGGVAMTVPRVANAASCDPSAGGWYYDDPQAPKRVLTCDATCKQLSSGATPSLALGCATTIRP